MEKITISQPPAEGMSAGEFVPNSYDALKSWLPSQKNAVHIAVDLSSFTDRRDFMVAARLVKGFIENNPLTGREASIKATKEQKAWEQNVFSSGINFIEAT